MKIAAFLNDEGRIQPFYSSGVVAIYSSIDLEWECVNQIPFEISIENRLSEN